jgi:hypothetical protein
MASLTPSQRTLTEEQQFLHLSSRQLIAILLLVSERPQIPPRVIERTVDPLRAELRRRETLGFDDPFESPYPEVTW